MVRKTAYVLSASLLATVLVHAQAEAQAPTWNYYAGHNSLPTIPYANGAMSSSPKNNAAAVYLNLNGGGVNAFTMDTGSTGLGATSKYFTPGPKDINQGPGSVLFE